MVFFEPYKTYNKPEKPEPIEDHLDIIDESDIEAVEQKYGCKMEEIDEEDLMDIVSRYADVWGNVLSAEWNRPWLEIDYTYEYVG